MNKIKNFIIYLSISLILVLPVSFSYADACPPSGSASPPSTAVCNPAPNFFLDLTQHGQTNTFPGLILFIIQMALGVVGLLSMGFIIIGGFQYITSRGNEEQAETGKKTLTNAIIGLVIVILSYIIVVVIINALKGKV